MFTFKDILSLGELSKYQVWLDNKGRMCSRLKDILCLGELSKYRVWHDNKGRMCSRLKIY